MSVVSLPRRGSAQPAPSDRSERRAAHGTTRRWRPWALITTRSRTTKCVAIIALAVVIVLAGNTLAAERQVQLHQMQQNVLADQARYARQVAALTNEAAPARIAREAGHLHLVVPTSVTQITTVPLDVVLAPPHLSGEDTVVPRSFQ